MNDLPPLLRHLTLASLLGVTPKTVAAMCRRGELPGVKIGRAWIVRRDDLFALLDRRKRERRPPSAAEREPARVLRFLPPPRRGGLPPRTP